MRTLGQRWRRDCVQHAMTTEKSMVRENFHQERSKTEGEGRRPGRAHDTAETLGQLRPTLSGQTLYLCEECEWLSKSKGNNTHAYSIYAMPFERPVFLSRITLNSRMGPAYKSSTNQQKSPKGNYLKYLFKKGFHFPISGTRRKLIGEDCACISFNFKNFFF